MDKQKQRVRLIETGEIFESATKCAKELGVSLSSVIRCAQGKIPRCAGYHIEYMDE